MSPKNLKQYSRFLGELLFTHGTAQTTLVGAVDTPYKLVFKIYIELAWHAWELVHHKDDLGPVGGGGDCDMKPMGMFV